MSLGQTPLSLKPGEVDNTEGTGQNKINLSSFGIQGSAKSASVVNSDGSPVPPPKGDALLFKTDTSYGTSSVAQAETSKVSKSASAVDKSKKVT